MFKAIESHSVHAVFSGIVDTTTLRVSTIYENTRTGKFFIQTEWTGYEHGFISLATVYKTVRKFDTVEAARTYITVINAGSINTGRFAAAA